MKNVEGIYFIIFYESLKCTFYAFFFFLRDIFYAFSTIYRLNANLKKVIFSLNKFALCKFVLIIINISKYKDKKNDYGIKIWSNISKFVRKLRRMQ